MIKNGSPLHFQIMKFAHKPSIKFGATLTMLSMCSVVANSNALDIEAECRVLKEKLHHESVLLSPRLKRLQRCYIEVYVDGCQELSKMLDKEIHEVINTIDFLTVSCQHNTTPNAVARRYFTALGDLRRGYAETRSILPALDAMFVSDRGVATSTSPAGSFFGSPGFDRANAIISDGNAGYYLVGSSVDGGSSSSWLAKYHPENTAPIMVAIDPPDNTSRSVLFDTIRMPDGDLIAAGFVLPTSQELLPENEQKDDGWVIRFSPDGEIRWNLTLPSMTHERLYFVNLRPDGDILVGGRSETQQRTGDSDGVAYVIDPKSGEITQRSTWGDSSTRSAFYDGVSLPNGGYIMVGWITDPETATDDVWLVAVHPNHTKNWITSWGGTGDDLAYDAVLSENGGFSIFGWATDDGVEFTSGLVARYDLDGHLIQSATYKVGDVGNEKFYFGLRVPDIGYLAVGEASSSPMQLSQQGWMVKLDGDLSMQDQHVVEISGSKFLGMVTANKGSTSIATGYGISPKSDQVDAWITEIR